MSNEPQSIEHAPDEIKDGRRILVLGVALLYGCEPDPDDEREWYTVEWSFDCWRTGSEQWVRGVTHWCPLPPKPDRA